MSFTLFFVAILLSIVVGWFLGMTSTWLILARTLPWLDYRMLPRPSNARPVVAQKPDLIGLDPALLSNGAAPMMTPTQQLV